MLSSLPEAPARLSFRTGAALFAPLCAFFLLMNRAAYSGYFQRDDFAHMSWCAKGSWTGFLADAISPEFYPHQYRPIGHLHYYLLEKAAGLRFPVFVAFSQAYHLATAWLVWVLLRRLRFTVVPAAAAVVLFTLNMATFCIYWNPAYIFDLGCGLFCLVSLLFWMDRRWVAR